MPTATPDLDTDIQILSDLEQQFEKMYQVVILDSDKTTFEEVIASCIVLFEYTPEAAEELAWRVHRSGEAVAHVGSENEAQKYVVALKVFNVRATVRPVD